MATTKKQKVDGAASDTLMLGYLCVQNIESLGEKVLVLDRFGLTDADLAAVCGVEQPAIRDARYKHKKKSRKGRERKEAR